MPSPIDGNDSVSDFPKAGFFNVYKPKGQTSFSITRAVTKLLKDRGNLRRIPGPKKTTRKFKVGHAGTLDPIAEGVLLVCFGYATRLIPYIHLFEKCYRATFRLGCRSESDDTEKELISTDFTGEIGREEIAGALTQFEGEIEQVPPAFSAVKVAGRQAYQLARKGEDVPLSAKRVTVHEITLLRFEYPKLELDIRCSSGTYIRSIGRDLGESLGCGAVMTALTRTAVGNFTLDDAVPFLELDTENMDRHVRSPVEMVDRLPKRNCCPKEKELLANGLEIVPPPDAKFSDEEEIAVVDSDGNLVAICRYDKQKEMLRPKHVFCVNTE